MLLHNNKFSAAHSGGGTSQPSPEQGNVTLRVLGGAQQHCLCFQGADREQGAYLNLQGAGFRVDKLPWCWALPQATHTCRMWFLIEQGWLSREDRGVSSLEHLSLPLSTTQTFARGAYEENTLNLTGEVLWLLLLPRNPFSCTGRPGQAQFTHTYPSLSGEQLSWILPPLGQ